MNALVDKDDERLFFAAVEIFGNEGVAVKQDWVSGAGSLFVFDVLVGRAGVLVFVDLGYVTELLIPEEIVDAFEDDVGVTARLGHSCASALGLRRWRAGRCSGSWCGAFLGEGERGEQEQRREESKRRRKGAAGG
jgi:hypothetical protein